MRLKILLIKPFGAADEIIPPISLGIIAAQIRKNYEVRILDALKESMSVDEIARIVASEKIDVVGFQAWSKNIHEIRRVCAGIKAIRPETVTIVGGTHPTAVPEGTFRFFGQSLDYAYKGEAEIGFKMFLDNLSGGNAADVFSKIPGLVWRDGDSIRVNDNCFHEDLDSFGFPAWDLMPPPFA